MPLYIGGDTPRREVVGSETNRVTMRDQFGIATSIFLHTCERAKALPSAPRFLSGAEMQGDGFPDISSQEGVDVNGKPMNVGSQFDEPKGSIRCCRSGGRAADSGYPVAPLNMM